MSIFFLLINLLLLLLLQIYFFYVYLDKQTNKLFILLFVCFFLFIVEKEAFYKITEIVYWLWNKKSK